MAKQIVSLQVDEELKKKIDKFADKRGGFSKFIRDMIDFDPYFLEIITGYSDRHRLAPYLVIQNMMIKRFAYEAAKDLFYGEPQPRDLIEFTHTAEGFLTGRALYELLMETFYYQMGQQSLREQKADRAKKNKGAYHD